MVALGEGRGDGFLGDHRESKVAEAANFLTEGPIFVLNLVVFLPYIFINLVLLVS